MKYFKQEDFNKCMEFLADKPDTVETQQKLHNYMVNEHIYHDWNQMTVNNMCIYSKIYATRFNPATANWCQTMSDGSQVIWNRKYQEFYWIDEIGIDHCSYLTYNDLFPEMKSIPKWLLENWSNWRFQETQKQLVAIWNGKYDEAFRNYWRQ